MTTPKPAPPREWWLVLRDDGSCLHKLPALGYDNPSDEFKAQSVHVIEASALDALKAEVEELNFKLMEAANERLDIEWPLLKKNLEIEDQLTLEREINKMLRGDMDRIKIQIGYCMGGGSTPVATLKYIEAIVDKALSREKEMRNGDLRS